MFTNNESTYKFLEFLFGIVADDTTDPDTTRMFIVGRLRDAGYDVKVRPNSDYDFSGPSMVKIEVNGRVVWEFDKQERGINEPA